MKILGSFKCGSSKLLKITLICLKFTSPQKKRKRRKKGKKNKEEIFCLHNGLPRWIFWFNTSRWVGLTTHFIPGWANLERPTYRGRPLSSFHVAPIISCQVHVLMELHQISFQHFQKKKKKFTPTKIDDIIIISNFTSIKAFFTWSKI